VCIEGRVVYVYVSVSHSESVCAKSPGCKFYEPLKKLVGCKVPEDNMSEYHMLGDDTFCNVSSHYSKLEKYINLQVCFFIGKPPTLEGLCLEALE
jgi:hypothetical protein